MGRALEYRSKACVQSLAWGTWDLWTENVFNCHLFQVEQWPFLCKEEVSTGYGTQEHCLDKWPQLFK